MIKPSRRLLCFSAALLLAPFTSSAISLDFVTIGNPNNAADQDYGDGAFGSVSATYALGTREVTLLQYTSFLNAVARTDTHSLYNPGMATDLNSAGISRSGTSGTFAYSVIGDGSRPVTYVSWFDAARFSNWLHNGQPTGAQSAATTERGAYTLDDAVSGLGFAKNGLAQFWIPTENEWYKAAYHQPSSAGGDADGYWLYPTATNVVPNSRNGSATDANSANFFRNLAPAGDGVNDGFAVSGSTTQSSSQIYLTAAASFAQADSFYGTFDQGGNVYEWSDGVSGSSRVTRGGSWFSNETGLRASHSFLADPTAEYDTVGFRIATVPEPSSALLLAGACLGLLLRRRRFERSTRNSGASQCVIT